MTSPIHNRRGFPLLTTADCRSMMLAEGFSHLMDTKGVPGKPLHATAYTSEENSSDSPLP